ncbi:MAG: hypothetical protein ONA69_02030 [candidate division KSB1 bacterium]|nr:hypothetical protein [candidate division KSB1 bacterium]
MTDRKKPKLVALLFLSFLRVAGAVGERGSSFAELKTSFSQPAAIYAPFMFWFWDCPLDDEAERIRIARVAEALMEQRINPGYVHARFNMVGLPDLPREQWLSPLWFDTFRRAAEITSAGGYLLGFCGDYWWPTGQAAGRVLARHPDLWAVSLRWKTLDVPPGSLVEIPKCFFAVAARLAPTQNAPESLPLCPSVFRFTESDGDSVIAHRPALISSRTLRWVSRGEKRLWHAPKRGSWRVYVFYTYFHPGCDGGRVNYLDRRLADAFIAEALQPNVENLRPLFGQVIPGIFFDHEGDYGYKLAWSSDLESLFRRKTGEELRLVLPLLVDEDQEGRSAVVKSHWFDCVSDLYADFFRKINQWAESHGLWTVSNLWEENLMWQASAVGDFFKVQRIFSLPGTDALGLRAREPHDFVETRSGCEFENRRQQCEILGGAGFWGFTPITIKQAANAVTCWGVSHVTVHALFSTRKLEGNPWLPDGFDEHPWWPWLHQWSDFVRRASLVNSFGRSAADVLLLNPMDSVWGLCDSRVFDPAFPDRVPVPKIMPMPSDADIPLSNEEMKRLSAWWLPPRMHEWYDERVHQINTVYSFVIDELVKNRVEFLVADRYYLRQMRVEKGALERPPFRFHTLILPDLAVLPSDAAEKLVQFAESGGRVIFLCGVPIHSEKRKNDKELKRLMDCLCRRPTVRIIPCDSLQQFSRLLEALSLAHVAFHEGEFPLLQQHRCIEGRDFFWLANNTGTVQVCRLFFPNQTGAVEIWDCETGERRGCEAIQEENGCVVPMRFQPYEAFWLVFEKERPPFPVQSVVSEKLYLTLDGEWSMRIEPSRQPAVVFPRQGMTHLPKKAWRDVLRPWQEYRLQKFSGRVEYETLFTLPDKSAEMILDLGEVYWAAEVKVNGTPVGSRLWPPFRFDVSRAIQQGENRLQVTVGNLLNNATGDEQPAGLQGPVRLYVIGQP